MISSDPTAWLNTYWKRLHDQNSFFAQLAAELQANALAELVAQDHPAKAQAIREWNVVTRRAIIAGLDVSLWAKHANKQVELRRMRKGERELRCLAVYTVVGLDQRLLEAGDMLRTQLCRDAPTLRAQVSGVAAGVADSGLVVVTATCSTENADRRRLGCCVYGTGARRYSRRRCRSALPGD